MLPMIAWILLLSLCLFFLEDFSVSQLSFVLFLKKPQNQPQTQARCMSLFWLCACANRRLCPVSVARCFEGKANDFSEVLPCGCEEGGRRQANSGFVWCPVLVVYRFSWLIDLFISPFTINFGLETFLGLWQFPFQCIDEYLYIDGWLLRSLSRCHSLGLPLENLTADLSSKHRKSLSVNLFHKACLLCIARVKCLETLACGITCCQKGQALQLLFSGSVF